MRVRGRPPARWQKRSSECSWAPNRGCELSVRAGLRFAVGTAERPLSPVWRLWIRRDDVYLTATLFGRLAKISLHGSGVWVFAFPSESGYVPASGNRRVARWKRQAAMSTGWTFGPALLVPPGSGGRAAMTTQSAKPIVWLSAPPGGHQRVFAMLFGPPNIDATEIRHIPPSADIVGVLPLLTLGTFVLASWIAKMSVEESAWVVDEVAKFRVEAADPGGIDTVWAVLVFDTDDGRPLLLELLLGPDNIHPKQAVG